MEEDKLRLAGIGYAGVGWYRKEEFFSFLRMGRGKGTEGRRKGREGKERREGVVFGM